MKRTNNQNKAIHALSNRLGYDSEDRAEMVAEITNDRTTKTSEMNVDEARFLINRLRQLLPKANYTTTDPQELAKDRKRKRVISHLIEAGYTTPSGAADMAAIKSWVRVQKFKKEFNNHSSKELSALIHAAEKVKDHFLRNVRW